MAVFGIEWFLSFQEVGDLSTETLSTPLDWTELFPGFHLVWREVLPVFFGGGLWEGIGLCRTGKRIAKFATYFSHDV
jgi:hypothetical protein